MQKNKLFLPFFFCIAMNSFPQRKKDLLNNDFINSKNKTQSQIIQEEVFGNYDEKRFELSVLKIDENEILNQSFFYYDENLIKCLAIYQYPDDNQLYGSLFINDEKKISNELTIKIQDSKTPNILVMANWNPKDDIFIDDKRTEKVDIIFNDVLNTVFIPKEIQTIEIYYQGASENQNIEFVNFDSLCDLRTVKLNHLLKPILHGKYNFNTIEIKNNGIN